MQAHTGAVLDESELQLILQRLEEHAIADGELAKINYDGFSQVRGYSAVSRAATLHK
jgi:hypothetical protein